MVDTISRKISCFKPSLRYTLISQRSLYEINSITWGIGNTVDILYFCLKAEEINARSFILVTQHSNLGSDSWFIERKPFFCLHSRI